MRVRSFAKYWIPVIAWVLLIFVMSGDLMSAEHTSRFFVPFLRWIAPGISAESIASLQFAVRKAAHLAEYAILALLLCRALSLGTNLKWSLAIVSGCAGIACVLVATGDEFRQSFVASRGASPWDVMIDGAGAILGLLIYVRFALGKSVRAG